MTEADWIPVTERLPDNAERVLVSFSNRSTPATGCYVRCSDGGGAWCTGDGIPYATTLPFVTVDLFVNARMPLPKCYEAEEQP